MLHCNFSFVTLLPPVVDGAQHVAELPLLQVEVLAEQGNGLEGNGGADGEQGLVEVGKIMTNGLANPLYFSLTRLLDGVPVDLQVTGEVFTRTQPGSLPQKGVLLSFTPVLDGVPLKLVSRKQYTFSYTSYLPVQWS